MVQGYDIYFDKVLLPVAPSKISTKIQNKNKTIDLINEGEVNVLKSAGLTSITFNLLLPNNQYSFAKYLEGFKKASYYIELFEQYKVKKQPFQLIISRVLPSGEVLYYTNLRVSLEEYTVEDSTSEGFDNTVSVKLLQYRDYGTKTVKITPVARRTAAVSSAPKRASGSGADNSGKTYKIISGDTLSKIAKAKMGKSALWIKLYNTNKATIEAAARSRGKKSSNNGHWIYPGTVLKIP